MDTKFHLTFYNGCNNLSMRGLMSIHVGKRGRWYNHNKTKTMCIFHGLVQDCNISTANTLEILQFCTKPSVLYVKKLSLHLGPKRDVRSLIRYKTESGSVNIIEQHQTPQQSRDTYTYKSHMCMLYTQIAQIDTVYVYTSVYTSVLIECSLVMPYPIWQRPSDWYRLITMTS